VKIIKEGKSSEKVSYKDMEFEVEGEVAVKEDLGLIYTSALFLYLREEGSQTRMNRYIFL
jgi:hypothetical protein